MGSDPEGPGSLSISSKTAFTVLYFTPRLYYTVLYNIVYRHFREKEK